MASIEYRPRATRVVAYLGKQRHYFPLGRVTKKTAERFANNIDTLLHERRCNLPISREVSNWLAGLDDSHYVLLADRGLVEPRQKIGTLGEFIESYIESHPDVSDAWQSRQQGSKRRLFEFFGDVSPDAITPADADEYARWLTTQVAATTAKKELQVASQFFRNAFRKELISRNPFDGVRVGAVSNNERQVFVPRDIVIQVLGACPNWQWRTVAALARYGGLRCSSEVALLKWSDIHWDNNRFTVTSPKTKRYGKGSRVVPLFPELRRFLDEAFGMAGDGECWVVPMLAGNTKKNLGTTFKKIIRRAGVEVWPKPFQNLRSSRQTELEQNYPTYVVCKWLGNTPTVAHKHYLTVTEEHYSSATSSGGQTGDKRGMQPPVLPRMDTQEKTRTPHEVRENASFSEVVDILENARVAGTGFEPATSRL